MNNIASKPKQNGVQLNLVGVAPVDLSANSTLVFPTPIWFEYSFENENYQTAVLEIEQTLSFLESSGIQVDDRQKVILFLQENYDIVKHLYDLPHVLIDFSQDSKFTLKVCEEKNVESYIYTKDMLLIIKTKKNIEDAKLALKKVEQEWLLTLSETDMNLFFFSIKF